MNHISGKKNIRKQRCNSGQDFNNKHGVHRPARIMKKACGHKCRYKCSSTFCNTEREKLFHSFWQLGDINKQRQFLLKHTVRKNKKIKSVHASRRNMSITWFLPSQNELNRDIRVCKTFFLKTLGISDKMVTTAYKKLNDIGICEDDKRGKYSNRPNKTSEVQKMHVRQHIRSFETVESHYCRRDSKKLYLPQDLSLSKMYRLYKEHCSNIGVTLVSQYIYNDVFNSEFNLAFHSPIKDKCDLCVSFANASAEEKEKMTEIYENHIKNKELARKHKEHDKSQVKNTNSETVVCCFDLEEVLLTPHSFESCLFYKRRLNSFDFTIYDMGTSDGHCYLWNEAISSRGACEIASCLFSFIQDMSGKGKKDFIMYSDNCCAQNKNKYFLTMLWYCLQKFNLRSITQKYLEKGHTQNEGDSIHAAIESASRKISIFTTSQWAATIRAARHSKPYVVHELNITDFFDFKELAQNLKNFEVNTDNEKVYWNSIKTITLKSTAPNQFEYQTDYEGQVHTVNLFHKL